jgi:hypothetical protein
MSDVTVMVFHCPVLLTGSDTSSVGIATDNFSAHSDEPSMFASNQRQLCV